MAKVLVEMTEQVSYVMEYDLAEFAEMIGSEATVAAVEHELDVNSSEDYGVEGCDGLLDDVIEKGFAGVSERSWGINVKQERCTVEHGDWTGPHVRISSCPEPEEGE